MKSIAITAFIRFLFYSITLAVGLVLIQTSCSRQGNFGRANRELTTAEPAAEMGWKVISAPLIDIWTSDGVNMWAAGGGGLILHSDNAGKTWGQQQTGTEAALVAIWGVGERNEAELWAVGGTGVILHSADGGKTWRIQQSGTKFFLNTIWGTRQDGNVRLWATGVDRAVGSRSSMILYSDDRGETWSVLQQSMEPITSLWATSDGDNVQLMAVTDEDLLYSSDGGQRWISMGIPDLHALWGFSEGNKVQLWGVGEKGQIVHSTDATALPPDEDTNEDAVKDTWEDQHSGTESDINAIWGVHSGNKIQIWAACGDGTILHSEDGGKTWNRQNSGTSTRLLTIRGTAEITPTPLWVLGGDGAIIHSGDGGQVWRLQRKGGARNLTKLWGICEPGGVSLWAIDADAYHAILHSHDAGKTWTEQQNLTEDHIQALWGSPNGSYIEIWAVGTSSFSVFESGQRTVNGKVVDFQSRGSPGQVVLHSVDGGKTWNYRKNVGYALNALWGIRKDDNVHLWAAGDMGAILHSDDAGTTWSSQLGETKSNNEEGQEALTTIWGIAERNEIQLWAVGDRGTIVHSNDGGKTWDRQKSGLIGASALWGVREGDRTELWAVGSQGAILHSGDSGATWKLEESGTTANLTALWGSVEGDKTQLWAVGEDIDQSGIVLHSIDGGKTWTQWTGGFIPLTGIWGCSYNGNLRLWATGPSVGVEAEKVDVYPTLHSTRFTNTISGVQLEVVLENTGAVPRDLNAHVRAVNDQYLAENAWKDLGSRSHIRLKPGQSANLLFPLNAQNLAVRPGDKVAVQIAMECAGFKQSFSAILVYESWKWLRDNWKLIVPIACVGFLLVLFTLLLFVSPLTISVLYRNVRIYELVGTLQLGFLREPLKQVLNLTILPFFVRHRRVLDAWVQKYRPTVEGRFESMQAAKQGGTYVPLPIRVHATQAFIERPSGDLLSGYFVGPRCLVQIVAAGGSGKTRLALEIGRWAMHRGDRALMPHLALPIFIDEDTDDVFSVVRRKLRGWLNYEIEDDFIRALLRAKRLLIIVDRLTEHSEQTRQHVRTVYSKFPVNALLITARTSMDFEAAEPTTFEPMPLDSSTLLYFMTRLLQEFPKSPFTQMSAQIELGKRLSVLFPNEGDRSPSVTPLLVKLFVEKAVQVGMHNLTDPVLQLPSSIPEVYFDYLRGLNPHGPDVADEIDDEMMLKVARLLSSLALGADFGPKEFDGTEALEALKRAGLRPDQTKKVLRRLVSNGVLLTRDLGGVIRYRYLLDPVCEYLGAYQRALDSDRDSSKWSTLLAAVRVQGESATDFLQALRLIWLRYRSDFSWPRDLQDNLV